MSAAVIDDDRAIRRAITQRLRGVYAITPELSDISDLVARLGAALEGGVAAIQYRNKTANTSERYAQAAALAPVVKQHDALFIVNDDPEIAAAVNADGVHLGEDDAAIDAARECVGPRRIIGISCYNDFERARKAVAAGADYVAFGSFFASSIKPHARRADVSLLTRSRNLNVPVVAIGGITPENAGELARAGADAVAVISAVFESSNPTEVKDAARALCRVMTGNGVAREQHEQ